MDIALRARNIDLPDDLRQVAEDELHRLADRLGGMDRAQIRFREERARRGPGPDRDVCEMTMHGHGHVVRARGAGHDWTVAVDRTASKLERQIERLRAKLADRGRAQRAVSVHFGHDDDPEGCHTTVAACLGPTGLFAVQPMTPEAAALQMDRSGQEFHVFVNVENGSTGVVYRRTDGHIGLIEAN